MFEINDSLLGWITFFGTIVSVLSFCVGAYTLVFSQTTSSKHKFIKDIEANKYLKKNASSELEKHVVDSFTKSIYRRVYLYSDYVSKSKLSHAGGFLLVCFMGVLGIIIMNGIYSKNIEGNTILVFNDFSEYIAFFLFVLMLFVGAAFFFIFVTLYFKERNKSIHNFEKNNTDDMDVNEAQGFNIKSDINIKTTLTPKRNL